MYPELPSVSSSFDPTVFFFRFSRSSALNDSSKATVSIRPIQTKSRFVTERSQNVSLPDGSQELNGTQKMKWVHSSSWAWTSDNYPKPLPFKTRPRNLWFTLHYWARCCATYCGCSVFFPTISSAHHRLVVDLGPPVRSSLCILPVLKALTVDLAARRTQS